MKTNEKINVALALLIVAIMWAWVGIAIWRNL